MASQLLREDEAEYLASLEECILRAVELVAALRKENATVPRRHWPPPARRQPACRRRSTTCRVIGSKSARGSKSCWDRWMH